MKQFLSALLLGLLVGAGVVWFGWRRPEHESAPAEGTVPAESAEAEMLKFDPATQTRLGLVVQPLGETNVAAEIRGDTRVLEASLLLQQWNELALARLAEVASRKEWERLKILFAQGQNASARSLEAGEAALKRDEAIALGAETRLVASWGSALANRADLPVLAGRLSHFELALVRVEFPLGVGGEGEPQSVAVVPLAEPRRRIPVEWLGPAPNTDPLTQGPAFLGLAMTNGLVPGTALTARVTVTEPPRMGVFVPASAVVRHEGETYVYGAVDAEQFARLPVILDQPLDGGWLVLVGLTNGQPVVVTGAQALLSAEAKPGDGEE